MQVLNYEMVLKVSTFILLIPLNSLPLEIPILNILMMCGKSQALFPACIWNAPAVSLVLPAFDDTRSLGSPPRQVVYPLG